MAPFFGKDHVHLLEDSSMFSRVRLLFAAALVLGGTAACADLTGMNARADGTFYLQTVNGNRVPYSYTDNSGNSVTVQGDTYALNSNGTYTEQATYRINNGTASQSESGNWSQSNNVVTFSPLQSSISDFAVYQGTLSNSGVFGGSRALSITINGTTAIYSE